MSTLGRQNVRMAALIAFIQATLPFAAQAGELKFREQLGASLIGAVPGILKTYHPETGHFGEGVWICRDQEAMYPLAVAYSLDVPGNKFHKDRGVLEAIMKAGDALAGDADKDGKWVFRKKDNSTWGMIWMPWTYSRWMRTFSLIREDMPPERRAVWEKALLLGYTGISKTQLGHIHNIPTHHAMALYIAGKTFGRSEWCQQAREYMHRVVAEQAPGGYWSEGGGPVVQYNEPYVEAIGIYYAVSGDQDVLPALNRAAEFHRRFTYPSGQSVETIDQRNPYEPGIRSGNVGFTFCPAGRTYLKNQWARLEIDKLDADRIASLLQFGREGPTEDSIGNGPQIFVLKDDKGVERAMTIRQGSWFVCLSAFVTPIATNRWHQDRQNLVSIFHDKTGLLVGGGNTKLQPAWSNFTIGDMELLRHKPGDTTPDFMPKGELYHVPSVAKLVHDPHPGLDLIYGPAKCSIRLTIKDDNTLDYIISCDTSSKLPAFGHVTLLPRLGTILKTAGGKSKELTDKPIEWESEQVGKNLHYADCEWMLAVGTSLHWPMLPHNPYKKDGHASAEEGRVELRIPFDDQHREHSLTLQVGPKQ